MSKIKQFQKLLATCSLAVSAVIMSTIVLSITWAVLCRYIFNLNSIWVEQYARYALIWAVFVAANVLIYRNDLMRVDFFDHMWPKKAMKIREGVYSALFVIILGTICWQGWIQAYSYWNVPVVGLPIDKFWVYFSIPFGSFLMLIQYALNLIVSFSSKSKTESKTGGQNT